MLNAIIRWSLNNRFTVLLLSLAASAYGTWVFTQLPVDVFPDLNRPPKLTSPIKPYWYHYPDRRLFFIAGIYWTANLNNAEVPAKFVIVTQKGKGITPWIPRVPVMLPKDCAEEWIRLPPPSGQTEFNRLNKIVNKHYPISLEAWPVSSRVNDPQCDDLICLEPVAQERV